MGSRSETLNHTHFLPSERTSLFFLESICKAPCRAERSFQFLGRRAGQKRRRGPGWAAAQGPARKGKRDVLWPLQEGLGPRARTMTQNSRIAQTSAIAPLFPFHFWLRTCPSAPSPGLTMHPIFISVRSLPGPGSAPEQHRHSPPLPEPTAGIQQQQEKLRRGGGRGEGPLACFARSGVSGGL